MSAVGMIEAAAVMIAAAMRGAGVRAYRMGFVNVWGTFRGLFQECPSLLRVHACCVS